MATAFNKPALMIVDDEQNFTESLQLAIEDEFAVSIAWNLESARAALRRSIPAAILLDLRLPDGEGTELLQELRNSNLHPVVIVMTAHATADSFIKTQHEGAVDHFPKPLDIPKLKKVLRVELERRTHHR